MRYKFKSFLKSKMSRYLVYRRSKGYKAVSDFDNLCVFDRYVLSSGVKTLDELDEKFYLEMVGRELEELKPQTINHRLTVLRNFYKYLERYHSVDSNPVEFIPHIKELYYSPHVFDVSEIKKILDYMAERTSKSGKHFFFVRLSRYTAFSLQASAGLRVSELARLKVSDFNAKEKTIFIERSKFRKDRLIPISNRCVLNIQNYLSVRRSYIGEENPIIFLGYDGVESNRKSLAWYFKKVLKELDMYNEPKIKGNTIFGSPSPHSFRHSFAVNTVRRWASEGKDINKVADTLATYMGHCDFEYTQVYLKGLSNSEPLVFKNGSIYGEQ